jgi:hypothetical protein
VSLHLQNKNKNKNKRFYGEKPYGPPSDRADLKTNSPTNMSYKDEIKNTTIQ